MPRFNIRPLLLTLALIVCGAAVALEQPHIVYACSCVQPPAPEIARNEAAAVFAGKVNTIVPDEPDGQHVLVTFDLSASWKGPAPAQLTLITSNSSASCGVAFTPGEEYLVYGFMAEGRISTNLCTRTAPLANAAADLQALGPGTPVASAPAPVTSETMGVPWVPILIISAVILGAAALYGPALMGRRR